MVESERGKEGKPGQGCILELVTAVGNQDSLTGSVDCVSEWNTQGMEKRCRWHLSTNSHPPLFNSCPMGINSFAIPGCISEEV